MMVATAREMAPSTNAYKVRAQIEEDDRSQTAFYAAQKCITANVRANIMWYQQNAHEIYSGAFENIVMYTASFMRFWTITNIPRLRCLCRV